MKPFFEGGGENRLGKNSGIQAKHYGMARLQFNSEFGSESALKQRRNSAESAPI